MSQSLAIRRVAGAPGAEIGGVDLSQPMADETLAAIHSDMNFARY